MEGKRYYYFLIEQLLSLRHRLVYPRNHPVHRNRTVFAVGMYLLPFTLGCLLLLCSPLSSSQLLQQYCTNMEVDEAYIIEQIINYIILRSNDYFLYDIGCCMLKTISHTRVELNLLQEYICFPTTSQRYCPPALLIAILSCYYRCCGNCRRCFIRYISFVIVVCCSSRVLLLIVDVVDMIITHHTKLKKVFSLPSSDDKTTTSSSDQPQKTVSSDRFTEMSH